jgi:hypothetical protein
MEKGSKERIIFSTSGFPFISSFREIGLTIGLQKYRT